MGEASQPTARIDGVRNTARSPQRAFHRGRRRRKFQNLGGLAFPSQVGKWEAFILGLRRLKLRALISVK
jgi:hypothetical protein